MKMFGLKTVLAAGVLALFGSQAGATSLTCPAKPTEGVYRYLNLEYTDTNSFELSCLAWGVGDGDADKTFQESKLPQDSWVKIGKEQDNNLEKNLSGWMSFATNSLYGSTSGNFTISNYDKDGPLEPSYESYAMLWKFGGTNLPANWMVVQLDYSGLFSIDIFWEALWIACPIQGGKSWGPLNGEGDCDNSNNLSHFTLFGKNPTTTVPLPAGGVLLLTALGGMALVRRRRLVAA